MRVLEYIFQVTCKHNLSWPITVKSETYQRCLDCGAKLPFCPINWRRIA
jgi:hypothetical protein